MTYAVACYDITYSDGRMELRMVVWYGMIPLDPSSQLTPLLASFRNRLGSGLRLAVAASGRGLAPCLRRRPQLVARERARMVDLLTLDSALAFKYNCEKLARC